METWFNAVNTAVRRHGEATVGRLDDLSDDALVTSVVAECYFGCGRTTLHEMRKRGELETVRIGKRSIRYVVGSLRRARKALSAKPATPMSAPIPQKIRQAAEERCA